MRLQLDPALTGTGITGPGDTGQTAGAGATNNSNAGRIGDSTAGGDSIQISGPSTALNSLSADRAARLQQLTAQVQGGSYQVSGSLVSRAIVGDAVSQSSTG
jgi:anti-sigma28 factor (negative regulator of flagellin synthesis)